MKIPNCLLEEHNLINLCTFSVHEFSQFLSMSTDKLFEYQRISRELIKCGCCARCILRFLNIGSYENPNAALSSIGVHVDDDFAEKQSPCCICVGSLDDSIFDEILNSPDLENMEDFQSNSFSIHVRLPMIIPVRDKCMVVHLREKFPELTIGRLYTEKAFKRVLIRPFEDMFKKIYDKDSRLTINIQIVYDMEFDETSKYRILRVAKSKKKRHSRSGILMNLKQCPVERMKKHTAVPPYPPPRSARFDGLVIRTETFHITGRYLKFSRNLPQYIKNNPQGNSIEKMIVDTLTAILGHGTYVFKAVGHDEPDDRVLESGRLFSVQIHDTYYTTITFKQFEMIENHLKQDGLIEIINLHNISRRYLGEIVESEKRKDRHVRVFCSLMVKDIDYYIEKINELSTIEITQKTPIRLLHDRDLFEVTKKIYSIKAAPIQTRKNLIQLEIKSQTGFKLPEFINGDLGRTIPNLSDLIGQSVEYVATDILIDNRIF